MSRPIVPAAACVAAVLCLPMSALAEDKPPAARYSMQPVDGGVVRMDNETGEMSLCHVEAKAMVCDGPAGDPRAGSLQDRVDRLERRVERLEGRTKEPSAETAPLPTDQDLDRAMNAFERVMRHLFKMVDGLNRDWRDHPEPEKGSAPGPQKT